MTLTSARGASLLVAGALLPQNAVGYGPISLAEVAVVLIVLVVGGRWRVRPTLSAPLVAVVLVGLPGIAAAYARSSSESFTFLLAAVPVAILAVVAGERLKRTEMRVLALGWVVGVSFSVIYGQLHPNPWNGRISGWATHPNMLALEILYALPFVLAMVTAPSPRRIFVRAARLAALAVLLFGALQTGSRTALVVATLVIAAWVLLSVLAPHARIRVAGLTLLTGAAVALAATGRLSGSTGVRRLLEAGSALDSVTASNAARSALLEAAGARLLENPILGGGVVLSGRAHSLYVELPAAVGVFGVLALLLLVGTTGKALAGELTGLSTGQVDWSALAVTVSCLAYLVFAVTDTPFWDRHIWVFFGLQASLHAGGAARRRGMGS